MDSHQKLMEVALAEAELGMKEGELPFGAVVAINGEIVARAHSIKIGTFDCTAHSETRAIGMATSKLRRKILPEATFYATCEPCPMCLGAIFLGGVRRLVLGARMSSVERAGVRPLDFHHYSPEKFAEMLNWDLEIVDGVASDRSRALLEAAFFEVKP